MCIQIYLQVTDIINDKCYPHSFAFYFCTKKSATWAVSS